MATMTKGSMSYLLFNLQKMLNHRITVLCITAALGFYVLWQAGSLVWKFWLLDNESPQAAALVVSSPGTTEPESLQNILRYPLIRSASNPLTEDAASGDHPRTSLNLKLVGLMYSTDPKQARAIIESEEDGARSFSTHERVADKVEVYSIEADRVILLHAGRREALLLDPEEETPGAPTDSAVQSTSGPADKQASAGAPAETSAGSAEAQNKLDDVMRDFKATPVMEDGELLGFRLNAVGNPQIMDEWGLDPEDVITAVNGMPLNSQGRIMILYDKLKKQREFDLTLNRGGNSRTITVDLYD
jgi:general secretion pathway protein C